MYKLQYRSFKMMEAGEEFRQAWKDTVAQRLQECEIAQEYKGYLYALALAINDHETMDPSFKRELISSLLPDAIFA